MNLNLLYNDSDPNVLHKKIRSSGISLQFVFKDRSSLYNPTIIVQTSEDLTKYNYASIPEWNRYYFVNPNNINVIGANRYEVTLTCDSLTTFADQIIGVPCIIDRAEGLGGSRYLPSEAWVANCKHKTDILSFSSGLLDSGEFILITAGG